MNIYELQSYLTTEVTTGYPQELTSNLEDTKEALDTFMILWASYRKDPIKLQSKISQFIGQLIEEASKSMPHEDYVPSAEDMRDLYEHTKYQAKKDRHI
jgi:hypothetical protein